MHDARSHSTPQPILLVGYSSRMLAELATRSGYSVLALDYFGDLDLRRLCPSFSLLRDLNGRPYRPESLVEAARGLGAPAISYGASFENYPAAVAQLARGRLLLGNSSEVLARVRDPFQLEAALKAGGFAFPRTLPPGQRAPAGSRHGWLWKPLLSGGGHAVRPWRSGPAAPGGVLQQRLDGLVGSAAFIADGRRVVLLGLTEQLVGRRAFGARGFRYCGNLTPPRLPAPARARLLAQAEAVAAHLATVFGLRGYNGIDFVWHRGRLWTIEVNPRPSASMELLDDRVPGGVFHAHVQSFSGALPEWHSEQAGAGYLARGKAVLYATADVLAPDTTNWPEAGVRDVPHPGERIGRGNPICTLLASAATPGACLRRLRAKAAQVRAAMLPVG